MFGLTAVPGITSPTRVDPTHQRDCLVDTMQQLVLTRIHPFKYIAPRKRLQMIYVHWFVWKNWGWNMRWWPNFQTLSQIGSFASTPMATLQHWETQWTKDLTMTLYPIHRMNQTKPINISAKCTLQNLQIRVVPSSPKKTTSWPQWKASKHTFMKRYYLPANHSWRTAMPVRSPSTKLPQKTLYERSSKIQIPRGHHTWLALIWHWWILHSLLTWNSSSRSSTTPKTTYFHPTLWVPWKTGMMLAHHDQRFKKCYLRKNCR